MSINVINKFKSTAIANKNMYYTNLSSFEIQYMYQIYKYSNKKILIEKYFMRSVGRASCVSRCKFGNKNAIA